MFAVLLVVLCFASYIIIEIVAILVRNHKAHKFFLKQSPSVPVVPHANILAGHALSITSQLKNWKIIEDLHEKYGPTFGYYMCDQPWVSTKDLDLIKLIEVDEGHKHLNRGDLMSPFHEFNNSLLQITGERWIRVRRVFAAALR